MILFLFNKMAIPAGKTPISYLQEYCTKRGLTPQYELLSHEGAVHDPTFIMQVSVADTTAEGKGLFDSVLVCECNKCAYMSGCVIVCHIVKPYESQFLKKSCSI